MQCRYFTLNVNCLMPLPPLCIIRVFSFIHTQRQCKNLEVLLATPQFSCQNRNTLTKFENKRKNKAKQLQDAQCACTLETILDVRRLQTYFSTIIATNGLVLEYRKKVTIYNCRAKQIEFVESLKMVSVY